MLQVKIYDVDHGNCAYLVTPNGESILIDASHHSDGYFPRHEISADLRSRGRDRVTMFVNSNADHDHVSDLHNVREDLYPLCLLRNKSIPSSTIRAIKEHPLTEGLEALCRVSDEYNGPAPLIDWGGVEILNFSHSYEQVNDTNNASVVTFFFFGGFGIVFPGDLETSGWIAHLANPAFVNALQRTKVFVASHHGREGGYCKEVFDHCKPDLVVVSDKPVVHDTQDHSLYAQHATGYEFPSGTRKVVTTRCDGSIYFQVPVNGGATCNLLGTR